MKTVLITIGMYVSMLLVTSRHIIKHGIENSNEKDVSLICQSDPHKLILEEAKESLGLSKEQNVNNHE